MKKYVDICKTLEILKQDSGILPKPEENWKTFVPGVGDTALVLDESAEYEFDGSSWVKVAEGVLKKLLPVDLIREVQKEAKNLQASETLNKHNLTAEILQKREALMSIFRKGNR